MHFISYKIRSFFHYNVHTFSLDLIISQRNPFSIYSLQKKLTLPIPTVSVLLQKTYTQKTYTQKTYTHKTYTQKTYTDIRPTLKRPTLT